MICPSHAEFIMPLAVIVSNGEDTTESLIDGVGFTDDLPTADSAHIPDTGLWSGVGSINALATFDLGSVMNISQARRRNGGGAILPNRSTWRTSVHLEQPVVAQP
jgi:hypothetical protein